MAELPDPRRQKLSNLLNDLAPNVYFQPRSNVTMKFPCITYERSRSDTRFAGNLPYSRTKRYTLTVIDKNPDSEIVEKVAQLPMCTHSAFFVVDNLNHDVFDIFI